MAVSNNIRICTYNCRGWNSGKQYVSKLLQLHNLCLIQEHWLLHDHLNSLNFSSDVLSVAVSGMDDTDLILGHPFGGCGIIYHKSLAPFIRKIYSPSKRFCAVSVTLSNTCDHSNVNLLLICVYLPTNYGTEYSDALFVEAIGELEGFIQCTSFDCLFVCGDFNVDFNHSSCRRSVLSAFMHSINVVSVDCNFPIGYTYHRGDNLAQSWPDHILTYPYHSMLVSNVSTLSCVDNFSDHLPLSFSLNLSFPPHCSPVSVTHDSSAQDSKTPSVSWFKITPSHNDQYCQCVACNLPQIPNELLACCAPHCVSHFEMLDQLCSSFLASLQQASAQCLPQVRKRKTCVPDWNVSANKLKQSARFWYRV